MATGAPDGVLMIQVAVTVENVPVVPTAARDFPRATFGSVSTSSASYQTVKTITVTTGRVGILRAIEMACDDYATAQWKLVIGGVTIFEDILLPESFTKEFPDIQLVAAAAVTLSVKSDGSTVIAAYGDFAYKEVG